MLSRSMTFMAFCVIIVVFYHKWRPTCKHLMFLYIIASLDDTMYIPMIYTFVSSASVTSSVLNAEKLIWQYTRLILQGIVPLSITLQSKNVEPKSKTVKNEAFEWMLCSGEHTLYRIDLFCMAYGYLFKKKPNIIMISNNITLICCMKILDKLVDGRFEPTKVV